MEKNEIIKEEKSILFEVIVLVVLLAIPLSLLAWGNYLNKQAFKHCSVEVTGYVSDVHVEDNLHAPYRGGEVTTRHRTYVTYSFDVDDNSFSVVIRTEGTKTDYPTVILFRYNPDNPGEFYWDMSEWKGKSEPDWYYCNGTDATSRMYITMY